MSFIELFGGEWETKSQMSHEDALKFHQLMPKLQLSSEFLAKMGEFGLTGKNVKSTIKEVGNGVYSIFIEMGDITQDTKFTLDGKKTENSRMFDGKKMLVSSSFVDGVWTMEIEPEGCIKTVNVCTRQGNELHVTEKYEDLEIKKVSTKV